MHYLVFKGNIYTYYFKKKAITFFFFPIPHSFGKCMVWKSGYAEPAFAECCDRELVPALVLLKPASRTLVQVRLSLQSNVSFLSF